jgi:UDP-N-acetyl-2-amino-2-deoxyglucuronate dehydrogenase
MSATDCQRDASGDCAIGWGVIGCGVIGPTHMQALQSTPSARLVAVCDVVSERADKAAADFGVCAAYSIADLLARDDIQAVSVCTPSGMHAEHAIMAAQAGKHVLSEKPLDIRMAAMEAMIAACDDAGVRLAGVFQMRTEPSHKRVRDAVRGGKLGKLVLADMAQKYYRSHQYYASGAWRATWELDGGGALMNQCVHGIDLLQWVVGDVARVSAWARRLVRNIAVEDTAVANLEFVNGALGTIVGTTSVSPGYAAKLEVHGDLGTIRTDGGRIVEWQVPGEDLEEMSAEDARAAASDPGAVAATGHIRHIEDLARAIIDGRDPEIPGRDAVKAVKLIRAIYLSSREGGAPVELAKVSNDALDEDGIYPTSSPDLW